MAEGSGFRVRRPFQLRQGREADDSIHPLLAITIIAIISIIHLGHPARARPSLLHQAC